MRREQNKAQLMQRIKNLNCEIKNYYRMEKGNKVRRNMIPGNTKSLWDAVKIAKDKNIEKMPNQMFMEGRPIKNEELPDTFANQFEDKINKIVDQTKIDQNVYNGTRKMYEEDYNFMTEAEILEAVSSLKMKNSEGYD